MTVFIKDMNLKDRTYCFFLHPNIEPSNDKIKNKVFFLLSYLIKLFFYSFFITIPFTLIGISIKNFFDLNNLDYSINIDSLINDFGPYYWLFLLFLGPLIEELIFRLPIIIKKKNILIASLIETVYCVVCYIRQDTIVLLIPFLVLFLVSICSLYQKNISPKYFLWTSIFIFSSLHIFNYNNVEMGDIALYFICVMPRMLILATGISFIRCYLGFWYGFLFHCLYNSIVFLFMLI